MPLQNFLRLKVFPVKNWKDPFEVAAVADLKDRWKGRVFIVSASGLSKDDAPFTSAENVPVVGSYLYNGIHTAVTGPDLSKSIAGYLPPFQVRQRHEEWGIYRLR